MVLLETGEWWHSNIFFGAVFLVAGIIIAGLAWYVLRGDRLNRAGMDEDPLAVDAAHGAPEPH